MKISELNESHRVSAISWDKFARNIRIELAKTPDERTDAGHFIKVCRQEFDRLMETSPTIPDNIVNEFIEKFRGNTENEKEKFKNLKKPDICDTITTVNETRHKWYLDERKRKAEDDELAELENPGRKHSFESISANGDISNEFSNLMLTRLKDIRRKKATGTDFETILKTQDQIDKEILSDKKLLESEKKTIEKKKHMERIQKYIETFYGIYQRFPLKEEIQETLRAEVDEDALSEFLLTYDSTVFAL